MFTLSEALIAHKDLENFDDLIDVVQAAARNGEIHFRMDVKPPFFDTPDNWEDRLEAAFSGVV